MPAGRRAYSDGTGDVTGLLLSLISMARNFVSTMRLQDEGDQAVTRQLTISA